MVTVAAIGATAVVAARVGQDKACLLIDLEKYRLEWVGIFV